MNEPYETRRKELADRLDAVRGRIDRARLAAGRSDPVTLVVVTKTYPADDALVLSTLGVRDFGENRDQEASAKVIEWAKDVDAAGRGATRWHMVGQLQTNKARSVACWADVVHSVDRLALIRALSHEAVRAERERPLHVLLQVSLDGSVGRAGADPDDVAALADVVAESAGLKLRGVMAVAPLGVDPAAAFDRLSRVAGMLRVDHPQATWISAGMSGDLEPAIAAGATHVRVGSAILGERAALG